jgi:hypothetical protein
MAVTQNTYTGDGSTVLFSFTFPYLETTDIKVSLDGTDTNAYTLANATTVQFTTAPANGVAIRIYRQTDDTDLTATFYPGSAIRSSDLNDNFTQNLYVTQEASNNVSSAVTTAASALTTANNAVTTANAAQSTANSANTTAASASASAASAVTTANAASASAASAVTTATNAENKADQAINAVANAILYTLVANVAAIPGSPANNDAVEVFDSTGIESFTPLSGVPAGYVGDGGLSVRIVYSTAASSWTWIQYFPNDPESRYGSNITLLQTDVGTLQSDVATLQTDVGQAQTDILGLDTTKLNVTTAASTYLTITNASTTYQTQAGMTSYVATADIGTTVQSYDADTVKTDVLPTFTVATRTTERTITAGAFDLSTGNLWTVGAITVPNPTNTVAGQTGAIRITAGPVVWSSNFKFPGGTAPTIAAFPAVIPYYVQDSSTILMGNVVEGIA